MATGVTPATKSDRQMSFGGAPRRPREQRAASRAETWTAWAFLSPYLILFVLFLGGPTIAVVGLSFADWRIVGLPGFAGLKNYQFIFQDPTFWTALRNTTYFVVLTVPSLILSAMILALLVNAKLRGTHVVRAIVYLPAVISVPIIGIIWLWMLDSRFGIVNYYLGLLGIDPINWLTDSTWAMPAIVIATVWWVTGTNMMIYLAGLQDIPEELYESAEIDGAGRLTRVLRITVPMLTNVHAFVIPYTFIITWQVFGQVFIMTGGGPGRSTVVLTQYIYITAFQNFQMGPAAAASVVMLAIMFACVLLALRGLKVKI